MPNMLPAAIQDLIAKTPSSSREAVQSTFATLLGNFSDLTEDSPGNLSLKKFFIFAFAVKHFQPANEQIALLSIEAFKQLILKLTAQDIINLLPKISSAQIKQIMFKLIGPRCIIEVLALLKKQDVYTLEELINSLGADKIIEIIRFLDGNIKETSEILGHIDDLDTFRQIIQSGAVNRPDLLATIIVQAIETYQHCEWRLREYFPKDKEQPIRGMVYLEKQGDKLKYKAPSSKRKMIEGELDVFAKKHLTQFLKEKRAQILADILEKHRELDDPELKRHNLRILSNIFLQIARIAADPVLLSIVSKQLHYQHDNEVSFALLNNPKISVDDLNSILNHGSDSDPRIVQLAVNHVAASKGLLKNVAGVTKHTKVLREIAELNRDKHQDKEINLVLANNEETDADTLKILADAHPNDFEILKLVIRHRNIKEDLLKNVVNGTKHAKVLHDIVSLEKGKPVDLAVAKNEETEADALKILVDRYPGDLEMLQLVIRNRNIREDLLKKISEGSTHTKILHEIAILNKAETVDLSIASNKKAELRTLQLLADRYPNNITMLKLLMMHEQTNNEFLKNVLGVIKDGELLHQIAVLGKGEAVDLAVARNKATEPRTLQLLVHRYSKNVEMLGLLVREGYANDELLKSIVAIIEDGKLLHEIAVLRRGGAVDLAIVGNKATEPRTLQLLIDRTEDADLLHAFVELNRGDELDLAIVKNKKILPADLKIILNRSSNQSFLQSTIERTDLPSDIISIAECRLLKLNPPLALSRMVNRVCGSGNPKQALQEAVGKVASLEHKAYIANEVSKRLRR